MINLHESMGPGRDQTCGPGSAVRLLPDMLRTVLGLKLLTNFLCFLFQHNLCCDNCHSHVAMALNLMEYNGSRSWNMVKLCFLMLIHGKYVK